MFEKNFRTSEEWLREIKASAEKLEHWLVRQYVGELRAASQFQVLADRVPEQHSKAWALIGQQESRHAELVRGLLDSRGLDTSDAESTENRYWASVQIADLTFEELAAAGHLAETMRLERIKLLASDPEVASDIRGVFAEILDDELWHAKALANMTTDACIARAAPIHAQGMNALGLTI